MKVLFDHNMPKRFRQSLPGHEIKMAREMGWEALANGQLLKTAAAAGFDAFISDDRNLEFQQNLAMLPLPVVVIVVPANTLPALLSAANVIVETLRAPLDRALYMVEQGGTVRRLIAPRTQ